MPSGRALAGRGSDLGVQPQCQERDVVLHVVIELVEQVVAKLLRIHMAAPGEGVGEPLQAIVQRDVAALDETVGVEQERAVWDEFRRIAAWRPTRCCPRSSPSNSPRASSRRRLHPTPRPPWMTTRPAGLRAFIETFTTSDLDLGRLRAFDITSILRTGSSPSERRSCSASTGSAALATAERARQWAGAPRTRGNPHILARETGWVDLAEGRCEAARALFEASDPFRRGARGARGPELGSLAA